MSQAPKNVLFVCIGNSCRSPMAEGFMLACAGDRVGVYSAGTHPAGVISQRTAQVMRERGIDLSRQRSKGLDEIDLPAMDIIVSMAGLPAEDLCPPDYRGEALNWDVADPVGLPIAIHRMVRDDVEKRVRELLQRIEEGSGGPV